MRISESRGRGSPRVAGFHEPETGSVQYVAACTATGRCMIVDPVQGYDPASAATSFELVRPLLDWIRAEGLEVEWVLDTHPHADHLSAADFVRGRTGARAGTGARVRDVAAIWGGLYGAPMEPEGAWDRLFEDGETFGIGECEVRVMLHPGHTLASVTFLMGDAAFVHDTFMGAPATGIARCDFPGGSAGAMWDSLRSILALPGATRLFVGHDYPSGREAEWESDVATEAARNPHLQEGREAFVAWREARDRTLPLPARMLAALQVNLHAGRLPQDGVLRIPLDRFPEEEGGPDADRAD
ncbi:glyoxylase-like metal-dependent hydrolase (beta-lactamase superfamily II) [Hasllibacter halocynthiae]|uniref:Glyoxylase-like metal-dependent hydrolase (Beta-lactamase superfamily II) n=1 Tax=Hasllibacter halocynthiae TaxID=595589 RepID=A0A2T0X1U8_9RHOB|nr:MBL fold metallo-hydrolase [Hasllibacter halocynthiae]PRY92926.1 glyoxylase-like metal-dependent hydrolase (beta-lactamase superfamily II) [Hasllibacter halocynthiae]